MWKKVLYIGIAAIIGIGIFFLGYSSNQYNHVIKLLKEAIADESKYAEVPKIMDGCFDTNPVGRDDSEKLDLAVFCGTSLTDVNYGNVDSPSRYLQYEKAYYFYIFKPDFTYSNINIGKDKEVNYTGIIFANNETGKTYQTYFVVGKDINSSYYIEAPVTPSQALINMERNEMPNPTAFKEGWGYMRYNLTAVMVEEITRVIGGPINHIKINSAKEDEIVYEMDLTLDFSQKFFNDPDMVDLFTNYNIYLDSYKAADGDKKQIQTAAETFNDFYEGKNNDGWHQRFDAKKEETGFTLRYDDKYIAPGSLIWQTLGIEALYLAVVALFYILLFHFNAIRNLFSRNNYKDYSGKKNQVMVNGKWVNKARPKPQPEEKTEISNESEPVEEVTASEVVAEKGIDEAVKTDVEAVNEEESSAEILSQNDKSLETIPDEEPKSEENK